MFEFSGYKQELNNFCIPDITNIIIGYVNGYIEEFDEDFIYSCIDNSKYLYYNKNKVTLIHYLFNKERYDDVKILLKNSKYLRAEHFQNKDEYEQTELSRLCYHEMHDNIIQIGGLKAEHFQNKDNSEQTELSWLCYNKMHDTIIQIDGLKAEHFQNKDEYGQTELSKLCYYKMHVTIIQINGLKAEHFQNKDKYGQTELYCLCQNKMHETIIQIDGLKAENFQNKNKYGYTELYWLCNNKMSDTIKLIGHNFVDGANEDKVFDNVQNTFWKLEHCSTDMEKQYIKEHILI